MVSEPTIILYGGTFDPPHIGHVKVVERTRSVFPQSQVWITVAPAPASAAPQHKAPTASWSQRLAMCRLNFAALLAGGGVEISELEAQLPPPNYTVQTLRHCRQQFPAERWGLLIGQDQLEQFAQWREPKEIVQLCDLLAISRSHKSSLLQTLERVAEQLGMSMQQLKPDHLSWQNHDGSIYLLEGNVSDAASRDLRKDPNQAFNKDWLVPEVAAYIQRQGLYSK